MIIKRTSGMNRRTVLRSLLGGACATIALPILETMLNESGNAFAQGAPLPTRFGLWFWGNGIKAPQWTPRGTGTDWQPRAELQPLIDAGLREHFNVITGLDVPDAVGDHPHHSGMSAILAGAHYQQVGVTRDTIVSTLPGPSVDQIAAAHFEGQTSFRSIELGVCHFHGTDEGTAFQHLSHNGPNDVNPSEYNPHAAYDRLFGMGPSSTQIDMARASVLDAAMGQIRSLQSRVGQQDQMRLERHFESIRTLELRLARGVTACERPDAPMDYPNVQGREQIAEKNLAMSEIMAYALACDLTRAFSVLFSTAGSGVVVWPAGAQNSLHQTCHDEAGEQPIVDRAVTYMMGRLADFLVTLRDIPEGDGTLLDHCAIMCTSELSDGKTHSNEEFPALIAGRGSGRLKGGLHVRIPRGHTSRLGLTALRGAGIPLESFGDGPGRVSNSIAEVES